MSQPPTFLSVFAGIGGFDLGLTRAGWDCAGQVEIDGYCRRVLARHWPATPRWGDVATVGAGDLPRIDLLCGGFPCQDLSVAGRRAGLAGPRSGLFFEFVRLARELRPAWVLLENVPGLLSSNGGQDFAVVLAALGELGYGVAWRCLDARWFNVPQRRVRVFLVGYLGAPCPPEVFAFSESVLGHPAESEAEGAELAGSLTGGTDRRGWRIGADEAAARQLVAAPAHAVTTHMRKGGDPTTDNYAVTSASGVRRLTPTECARLQGFADDWDCLCGVEPYSTWTCRCPDGPRYATYGNAVCVPVIEWLGRRLMQVNSA